MAEHYTGVKVLHTPKENIDSFYRNGYFDLSIFDGRLRLQNYQNMFLVVKDEVPKEQGGCGSALCRIKGTRAEKLRVDMNTTMSGIKPRNKEQLFAFDVLMDDSISVVSMTGIPGGGKTILALSMALQKIEEKKYQRIVLVRNMSQVGKNHLGYLPGDMLSKTLPFNQGYLCNIERLLGGNRNKVQDFLDQMPIDILPLQVIRGASWPNSVVILDECLTGESRILTEEGHKNISTLYNIFNYTRSQRKAPKVLSYNESNHSFEYKEILSVMRRKTDLIMKIECGNRVLKITPNHPILTKRGWIKASDILVGDAILTSNSGTFQTLKSTNDDQFQIIFGSYLGDGHLDNTGQSRYRLRVIHGLDQAGYLYWLSKIFDTKVKFLPTNGYSNTPAVVTQTKTFHFENDFITSKTSCPQWVLNNIDERALAIWFMDDGHVNNNFNGCRIYTDSFDIDSQERIVKTLQRFGLETKYVLYKTNGNKKYYCIDFNKENYLKLVNLIEKYIHPSMYYKIGKVLPQSARYKWDGEYGPVSYTVVDSAMYLSGNFEVFNLEVADNNNYLVGRTGDGMVVHNCQNTSPHEVLTFGSRVDEGSKVILLGDLQQRDTPVSRESTGLFKFVNSPLARESDFVAHIDLIKSERGKVAELFANIFADL